MRPCGCKTGNVCVCMCMERNARRGHKKYTRKCMHQMNAPNTTAKGTSPLQHSCRNAAQSACTGIHFPHPTPHPCNLCTAASLRAQGLSRRHRHGRGHCWDLGEGRLGCSRGREPGPWKGRDRRAAASCPRHLLCEYAASGGLRPRTPAPPPPRAPC